MNLTYKKILQINTIFYRPYQIFNKMNLATLLIHQIQGHCVLSEQGVAMGRKQNNQMRT